MDPLAVVETLVFRLTIPLVVLAGIIVALLNRRKHPKLSRFVVIAFSLRLGLVAIDLLVYFGLMSLVSRDRMGITQWIQLGQVWSYLVLFCSAIWWVLVLAAIFGWRTDHSDRPEEESFVPPTPSKY